jgi:hypothetical protein
MLMLLINNQNFKRYIVYLDKYPLDPSLPDVNDNLINKNIILSPFSDEILNDMQVKIFFNPYEGNLQNVGIGYDVYVLDIIVPIKYWLISGKGEIRVFRIAKEIANVLDNQYIAGNNRVNITRYRLFKVNNSYAGLTLWINVSNATVKGD